MKAVCGCDYIRNEDGTPEEKSEAGWALWAERKAKRLSRQDGITWNAVVSYITWRNAMRVSFGAQPYNLATGASA